jgi:hypothetical protein
LSDNAGPALQWEVRLLQTAWNDIDRAIADVRHEDLTRQIRGGSSFAWTLGHITHGIDSWINVRFLKQDPHPLYEDGRFLFGGDGRADDWSDIRNAVTEIRERALPFLLDGATDLDQFVPYDGSFQPFRRHGMQLRAAILQNTVHHIFHLGEIVTKREWMGYDTGSFPGSFVSEQ